MSTTSIYPPRTLAVGKCGDHLRLNLLTADVSKHAHPVACRYSLEQWDNGVSRFNFDAIVSDTDLAETYLVAFKATIQRAKASGLMCSCERLPRISAAGHPLRLDYTHHKDV